MSKHLRRLAAPRVLKIPRKKDPFMVRPSPGPHALEYAIPLGVIIRDYLHLCDSYKEARRIISNGDIIVDGTARKEAKYPCGLMDVVSIPKMQRNFRILYDRKGKLVFVPIDNIDAEWKLCRIVNKSTIRGRKTQLNFHDGRNKLIEKDEYKTGDVVKLMFKDNAIGEVYKFDKGTVSLITGGSHVGEIANIEDIQIVPSSKPNLAKMKGEAEFSTIVDYVFPIGKAKPGITLPEVSIA
jgi:small subunit ribosomal protein S4e